MKRLILFILMGLLITAGRAGEDDCCIFFGCDPNTCSPVVSGHWCVLLNQLLGFGNHISGPGIEYDHFAEVYAVAHWTFQDCPDTEQWMVRWCRDFLSFPPHNLDVYCRSAQRCDLEIIAECVTFYGSGLWIFDHDNDDDIDLKDYAFLQNQFRKD